MIIPRIKVKRRISAITQNQTTEYVLEVFIHAIKAYNTETAEEEGDYLSLPLEMFLLVKYNNRTDGDPVKEPVSAGRFMRVIEPDDLDTENPVVYGTEKLRWGDPDTPRASEAGITLLPATSYGGSELTLAGVENAIAPTKTYNDSGYYKSRLFVLKSESKTQIENMSASIKSRLEIFKAKYMADAEYVTEGTGVTELESYDI
jgi:hypothetical protein